jgi:protease PrsW
MEPEPWLLLAKCVLWGGTAAIVLALIANHSMFAILAALYGEPAATLLSAVLVAPVAEEVAKGVVLVLLFYRARHDFDGLTDGVVYATMVGLGFAATENILYYGYAAGDGDLAATFVIRGIISPYAHSLFTAMFGIGLGYAIHRNGLFARLAPTLGLTAGMALHAIWNLSAAVNLFDAAYALFMVPIFVGAVALAVRSQQHEHRVLREQLEPYARAGRIDADVAAVVCGDPAAAKAAARALGISRGERRRLQSVAARLALAEWRARRVAGSIPPAAQDVERFLYALRPRIGAERAVRQVARG